MILMDKKKVFIFGNICCSVFRVRGVRIIRNVYESRIMVLSNISLRDCSCNIMKDWVLCCL